MGIVSDKAKYTTIGEIAKAFASGELNRDVHSIMLDKGGMSASLTACWDENLSDDENDDRIESAGGLVEIEYGSPLEQALDALGIPWCWS